MKFFILLLFVSGFALSAQAQQVKWHTFSEAIELNKKEPRKIFIDVYTDWCSWCKVMDEQTFQDPAIAKILNEKYYPVKFNAERTDTVHFMGNAFVSTNEGRRPPHQLAVAMLKGKMSYPSVVFMNEENKFITAIPGFQKPEQMEPTLIYIHESLYLKDVDFQEYVKNYSTDEQ